MASARAVVGGTVGLHARPAALFVRAAAAQPVPVTVRRPSGEPVSAASILAVMSLGVGSGETVVLEADGEGAEAALAELVELLEGGLG